MESYRSKWWYRILKVLYILSFLCVVVSSVLSLNNSDFKDVLIIAIAFIIIIRLTKTILKGLILGTSPEWGIGILKNITTVKFRQNISDLFTYLKEEIPWYKIGAYITGFLMFFAIWIYAFTSWGFLLGLAFGWIPAIIGAFISAFIWPVVVMLILLIILQY